MKVNDTFKDEPLYKLVHKLLEGSPVLKRTRAASKYTVEIISE